jgi:hypothetical protein
LNVVVVVAAAAAAAHTPRLDAVPIVPENEKKKEDRNSRDGNGY